MSLAGMARGQLLTEVGTLRAFLSGKISYAYGWTGPSIVIDTACSSSLVSVVMACRALAQGDCTTALAGGVNAITSPDVRRRLVCKRRGETNRLDVYWSFQSPLPEPDGTV